MTLWPDNGWLNHCSVHITAQVFLTADILFLTHNSAKSPKSHTFGKNLQKLFQDMACQFMWSEVDYDVYEGVEWTKVLTITRTIFLFDKETNQARFADTLMFWNPWNIVKLHAAANQKKTFSCNPFRTNHCNQGTGSLRKSKIHKKLEKRCRRSSAETKAQLN